MVQSFITVTGLAEVQRMLNNAPAQIRKEMNRELKTAVGPILASAKSRAPVSGRQRKGTNLQGSIRLYARRSGIAIGSPLIYAPVVQFGHKASQRSAAGNLYTRVLHPTDYLLAAINANARAVTADVERAVQRTLDQLVSGL